MFYCVLTYLFFFLLSKSQIPLRYLVQSWFEGSPTGLEPVCDQLRTSFKPASVMEFGF